MLENFKGKQNTNGLDKNPQNIDKSGRGASIKTQIGKLFANDGALTIEAKDVLSINKNGSVTIKLATEEQAAMQYLKWAFSDTPKGADMLHRLQEMLDGKPKQQIDANVEKVGHDTFIVQMGTCNVKLPQSEADIDESGIDELAREILGGEEAE